MERTKVIYDNYVLFENGVVLSLITNRFLNDWVSNGYICININGNIHKLHRLLAKAFIANPDGFDCVDHIDHDRSNNDLLNLRWCNSAQNNQNQSKRKDNTTGEIGIYKYIYKKSNGNSR